MSKMNTNHVFTLRNRAIYIKCFLIIFHPIPSNYISKWKFLKDNFNEIWCDVLSAIISYITILPLGEDVLVDYHTKKKLSPRQGLG